MSPPLLRKNSSSHRKSASNSKRSSTSGLLRSPLLSQDAIGSSFEESPPPHRKSNRNAFNFDELSLDLNRGLNGSGRGKERSKRGRRTERDLETLVSSKRDAATGTMAADKKKTTNVGQQVSTGSPTSPGKRRS